MLAYTGLETVANYAEEARRPGRDLPRSLFSAISLVVVIYILIACVGLSAYPVEQRDDGARHRLAARADHGHRRGAAAPPAALVRSDPPRLRRPHGCARPARGDDDVDLGLRPARVLARRARAAACDLRPPAPPNARRAAHRSSRHARSRSPCSSGRRSRMPCRSSRASSASASCSRSRRRSSRSIRLRVTKPDLRRPFRVPLGIRVRGAVVPLPSIVGAC